MEKRKVVVTISTVPGREIYLQFTPLQSALEEIANAPENTEIWVDVKGRQSIPIQGHNLEERIQTLKSYIKNLLQNHRISSMTPEEELLKIVQS